MYGYICSPSSPRRARAMRPAGMPWMGCEGSACSPRSRGGGRRTETNGQSEGSVRWVGAETAKGCAGLAVNCAVCFSRRRIFPGARSVGLGRPVTWCRATAAEQSVEKPHLGSALQGHMTLHVAYMCIRIRGSRVMGGHGGGHGGWWMEEVEGWWKLEGWKWRRCGRKQAISIPHD